MSSTNPTPEPVPSYAPSDSTTIRTPVIVTLAVGALATVASSVAFGGRGLVAGALATVVVVGFFAIGQLVVGRVLTNNPALGLNVALLVYVCQIAVLFMLLALLKDATFFEARAFAGVVVACVLAWTLTSVMGMLRTKTVSVEPGRGPGPRDSGN